MLQGVGASPGIEIGKAHVLRDQHVIINTGTIPQERVAKEIERLDDAIKKSRDQLEKIKANAEKELGKDKVEIFGAHLMILEDEVLLGELRGKIKHELITAENAVSKVVGTYIDMFNNMEDEYLRERTADIKDIGDRLTNNLLGIAIRSLADISEEVIVVARDLTPSDTAQMNKDKVKAFATDMGGRTSHTAIMARTLGIPAVVGLVDISWKVQDGDDIIVDGNDGTVHVNPDRETLAKYARLKEDYLKLIHELRQLKDLPAETKDKARRVELSANIGMPEDCKGALENGAEGIGLFRTEFLYMDRTNLPSEDEQFKAYKAVAEAMAPYPVIIRTLDIGEIGRAHV